MLPAALLFIISLLIALAITVLVLEILFWLLGMILPIPPRIRQLVYAIVALCFFATIVNYFLGGGAGWWFYNRPLR
jgi:hypothetical protein